MKIREKVEPLLEQIQLCIYILFFVLFSWLMWWAGVSPRLIRGSEERIKIHHEHLNLGATLFVLLVVFLLVWAFRPGHSLRTKLKRAFENSAATAVSIFFLITFFVMIFGLSQAWSKNEEVAVLGVFNLPHFVNFSWQTSGYIHSALTSSSIYLFYGIVFVFFYRKLIKHMESGYAVALLMIIHLLVVLPKPPSLHPIASFGSYVLTPFIYFTALAIYCWANNRKIIYWLVYVSFFVFFLYLPYFAFKVLPPWHQPKVDVVSAVDPKAELTAIRPTELIFPTEESLAQASETALWCLQCHNVKKQGPHLLGPNLTGVFNRQIASVEDYGRYSQALVEKGKEGEYWTRENLSAYLEDGQSFAPGNLMNQQTDLSDPNKRQQVVDYLEYLSAE